MARELPPQLDEVAQRQRGVLSRAQLLAWGLTKDLIASQRSLGNWQRVYPGVYAIFSGEVGREAMLWAAVLYAGRGAVLSHQTATEVWRLADTPSSLIHLTLPSDRRVSKRPGLVLHLSVRALAAAHPSQTPPRTRVEETVIDLWESARTLDNAVGWVTSAIGKRLTTQDKLRQAMGARKRVRWRSQLAELLSPDSAGITR
jgi:predicted transcriptional regulator of viral defense system